jgi:hypothetical protein
MRSPTGRLPGGEDPTKPFGGNPSSFIQQTGKKARFSGFSRIAPVPAVPLRQDEAGLGETVFADDLTTLVALVQVIGTDKVVTLRAAYQAFRADVIVAEAAAPVNVLPAERFFTDAAGHSVIRAEPLSANTAP